MPLLKNKIVCITGASSGIGEACAIACAIEGADLILMARRLQKLEALAHTLSHQYAVRIKIMPLDVSDAPAIEKAFADLPTEWKNIAEKVYANMTPLSSEDIADSIIFCLTRPLHVNVSEMIILPTDQASISEVHRKSP
ncbi:MAG: SDR family NAD(P)-dependent oxidoreductase [Gammaproteobacteria bacterium]|nr:SDR family NAD(P)-dependent oxidoreductase [Gammaproteobacteria bacterium]MBP9729438.1 SDR family NAD(P)-dependent oxidoreductase [Gammaproteobacteria bacterium]